MNFNMNSQNDETMSTKTKLSDADIEMLISEVQIRPTLWNDCDKNFKNTTITRKLWWEVGARINISGEAAKSKWKNLKDKFRKLLAKIPYVPSGSEAPLQNKDTPKWKFFQLMMFIKDIISPGQTFGNLTVNRAQTATEIPESDDELSNDNKEGSSLQETERTESAMSMSTTSSREEISRLGNKRKKLKTDDKEDRLIKLEEKKIEAIMSMQKETEEKGPDYHFLISLLPYIEELDKLEKLQLRCQIQALVTDVYKKNRERRHSDNVFRQHVACFPVESPPQQSFSLNQYDVGNNLDSTNSFLSNMSSEMHIQPNSNTRNYIQPNSNTRNYIQLH